MRHRVRQSLDRVRHLLKADLVLAVAQRDAELAHVRGASPAAFDIAAIPLAWREYEPGRLRVDRRGTGVLRTAALATAAPGPFAQALVLVADPDPDGRDHAAPPAALVALWREGATAPAPDALLAPDAHDIVRDTAWRVAYAHEDRLARIHLDAVLATVPLGVVLTDESAGTALVNDAASATLHCPAGTMSLAAFSAALHDLMARCDDREAIIRDATRALTAPEGTDATWQWVITRPAPLVLQVSTRAVRAPAHRGRLWTFVDVSREAASHATLAASEARYRMVTESMQDIVSLHEPDSTPVYVSPSVERVLGVRAEALVGGDVTPWVHPDDLAALTRARLRVLQGEATGPFTWRCRRADGTTLVFESVLTPYRAADGTVWRYQTTTRDVTARAEAEAQLRERDERREHARRLEALGQLAGGVAHDFNNVLTILQGNLDHLRTALPHDSAGHEEIGTMLAAIERAASLTTQLLAFGRQQVLEQEDVSLDAVVHRIHQLLRPTLGEPIALETRLGAGAMAIRVDAGQLEQAIINLALNARDAMPDGGTLRIETRAVADVGAHARLPEAWRGQCAVLLRVVDTGSGMDAATQAKAFEPFFTTKPPGKGTGLGLASVYGFVRQSQGVAWIDSAPGAGTTVTLAFQATVPTPKAEGPPVPRAASVAASGRLLVVEDEPALRAVLARTLVSRGYDVQLAAHGAEALALLRHAIDTGAPPDAVVSDVVMPVLAGGRFVRELRALAPTLPLLLMSGYAAGDEARSGLTPADLVGPTAFIAKPFATRELLDRIAALLAAERSAA